MGELEALVVRLQAYVNVVANRPQDRTKHRIESLSLLEDRLQQTDALAKKILAKADEEIDAREMQRKAFYGNRYRELSESRKRLVNAVMRRGVALANFRMALKEQDHE